MNAFIISIGNELLSGRSVDTNSAYLSRQLAERGIRTVGHATIGDDQAAIADAIRRASEAADFVLITGGLGPTADDVTRNAVAEAMGVELELNETALAEIKAYFDRRNRVMVESNDTQAMIPVGASTMANSCGTAPGIFCELGRAKVFVMPGVPREMKAMFADHVLPQLPAGEGVIIQQMIRLFGAGESTIGEQIQDLMYNSGPVIVGTTVSQGLVSVRILSRATTAEQANEQAKPIIDKIVSRLGELVLGVGEEMTMENVVNALLQKQQMTLATAESCTGGLIGKMLTDISGSSKSYLGGVVSYSNDVKMSQLGVPEELLAEHGAVSEEVAAAMAMGVRERIGSDWGISITGIAGPTGGTEAKPVGLVFTALAGPNGVTVRKNLLAGDRGVVRLRAALTALDMLRLKLMKH